MKKIILILLICISLTSCNKEHGCWTCEFYPVNGITQPTREVCQHDKPLVLTDSENNTLPFNCHK